MTRRRNPTDHALLDRVRFSVFAGQTTGQVEAWVGRRKVGHVHFWRNHGYWNALSAYVHASYRKRGLGSAMYDAFERECGCRVYPSPALQEGGKALWRKRDAKAFAHWEAGEWDAFRGNPHQNRGRSVAARGNPPRRRRNPAPRLELGEILHDPSASEAAGAVRRIIRNRREKGSIPSGGFARAVVGITQRGGMLVSAWGDGYHHIHYGLERAIEERLGAIDHRTEVVAQGGTLVCSYDWEESEDGKVDVDVRRFLASVARALDWALDMEW